MVDALTLGLSAETLWRLAGVFLILVGVRCLPVDLCRAGPAMLIGVAADVLLISTGVVMLVPS